MNKLLLLLLACSLMAGLSSCKGTRQGDTKAKPDTDSLLVLEGGKIEDDSPYFRVDTDGYFNGISELPTKGVPVKHPKKADPFVYNHKSQSPEGNQDSLIQYRGQSFFIDPVPDCDTTNKNAFWISPCKLPVWKDGKIVGYTEKNFHLNTKTSFTITSGTSQQDYFLNPSPVSMYSYVMVGGKVKMFGNAKNQYLLIVKDTSKVAIRYTDSLFILHISPSYVKKINDSTYTFKNQ